MKIFIPLLIILSLIMTGCKAREVYLDKDRYHPDLRINNMGKYKGMPVYVEVTNAAPDTVLFGYKDANRNLWYITNFTTLHSYIYYTITAALQKTGMRIYDTVIDPQTVEIKITLLSMNSQQALFKVVILKNKMELTADELKCSIPSIPENVKTDEEFNKYAYGLIDAMANTIFEVLNKAGV